MKKTHIALIVLVAAGIAGLSFFVKDLSSYETFKTAAKNPGSFVVVKVKIDTTAKVEYDERVDPNKTVFYAVDRDGARHKVIYTNAKPKDIEKSDGLDLNGYMRDGYFECTKLQMKCPSKYKDDMNKAKQNLQETSSSTPTNNSAAQY